MAVHHAAGFRPWYRPHASTWVVVLLVSCGVVLIEVPAEVTVRPICWERWTQYQHGWPWVYLDRSSSFNLSDPLNTISRDAIPWLHAACWNMSVPVDGARSTRFRPRYIAADVLVGMLVICTAGSLAEWFRRRRRRVWQVSIRELLIGVLLCAAALGWWRYHHDRRKELFDLAHVPADLAGTIVSMREPTSGAELDFGYAGPGWLVRLVGLGPLEVFNEPVAARLSEDDPARAIRELSRHKRLLTHLREITVYHFLSLLRDNEKTAELDEESIRTLAQLGNLESISILGCRLDDRALDRLAEIPSLRKLDLSECNGMTDAGIARLRASPRIEELRLRETPLRPEP
jgi:hypothetical protein